MDPERWKRHAILLKKGMLTPQEYLEMLEIQEEMDDLGLREGYAEASASIHYGPGPYDARPEDFDSVWSEERAALSSLRKRIEEVRVVVDTDRARASGQSLEEYLSTKDVDDRNYWERERQAENSHYR